eukprot:1187923-Prorocentrum_minimum.AAC.1
MRNLDELLAKPSIHLARSRSPSRRSSRRDSGRESRRRHRRSRSREGDRGDGGGRESFPDWLVESGRSSRDRGRDRERERERELGGYVARGELQETKPTTTVCVKGLHPLTDEAAVTELLQRYAKRVCESATNHPLQRRALAI